MFSEELSCNAGRKKADESRARRKQIQQHQQLQRNKQQQLQLTKPSATNRSVDAGGTIAQSSLLSSSENGFTAYQADCLRYEVSSQPITQEFSDIDATKLIHTTASVAALTSHSVSTGRETLLSPSVPYVYSSSNQPSSASLSQLSAIERANHERQIRALKSTHEKSAVVVQAKYRQYRAYSKGYDDIIQQLQSQISDLDKLNVILMSKKSKNIIWSTSAANPSIPLRAVFRPPTQTTTSFVRQLFFICKNRDKSPLPHSSCIDSSDFFDESIHNLTPIHIKCLQQILELCIFPSFLSNNDELGKESTNIFDYWIQNEQNHGAIRIRKLLRLISLSAIHPDTNQQQLEIFLAFLKVALSTGITNMKILDNSANYGISTINSQQICRSFLFPLSSQTSNSPTVWPLPRKMCSVTSSESNANDNSTIDWVLLVRHYLLFYQRRRYSQPTIASGSRSNESSNIEMFRPIPNDVDTKREESFSHFEKIRASGLLYFLMEEACSSKQTWLQSKIISHIFTIPLLTWRIKIASSSQQTKKTTISYPIGNIYNFVDISEYVTSSSLESPPPLIQFLQAFLTTVSLDKNAKKMSLGSASKKGYPRNDGSRYLPYHLFLPTVDVPLTVCPVTPSQCLLANLVQFGRLCPALNPTVGISESNVFSYRLTAFYFDFISLLVDEVPLSTYTTKESSAVEWIDDGHGHFKPIILSNIVLDQCKGILVDSYVRKLFLLSMNNEKLQNEVDITLKSKTDTDIIHEKDMREVDGSITTAAELAAKQCRIDQNRNFWNSSKWAKKIAKSVGTLLSTSITSSDNNRNDYYHPKEKIELSSHRVEGSKSLLSFPIEVTETFTLDLFLSLCRSYAILISRWGGNGATDLVEGKSKLDTKKNNNATSEGNVGDRKETNRKSLSNEATSRLEPFVISLLNVLSFSTSIVGTLWGLIQHDQSGRSTMPSDLLSIIDSDKGRIPVQAQSIVPVCDQYQMLSPSRFATNNDCGVLLFMFLCTFSHVLIITDDVEIRDMDKPIPLHQIRRCILVLKKLLYRAACIDTLTTTIEAAVSFSPNYFGYALLVASSKTMKDLYDRSSRKPFCLPIMWTIPKLLEKEVGKCKSCSDYGSLLSSTPVLKVCPFLVPFKLRLKLFERIITTNRVEIQGENSANPFHNNPLKPGIPIRIRRGRSLEDGLVTMNSFSQKMFRERFQIQYYNEGGARETGIDAGGLFKDFWTDLCDIAFNPNYALFRATEDGALGNCLYPNPLSRTVHGSTDHVVLFEFLGRILGKALYEGITISPRFAHFFLSFIRGDYNFLHMLPDLSTIDPQLFNNLMFLKNFDGDCCDLCLTFTVTTDEFGGNKEVPLIPNGANVEVTNENKQRYIGLVAKHYVYDRVKEQSEAFTKGLRDVLDRSWLLLFNEPELQVLISGVAEGNLDIEDMKANVQYVGGYSSMDLTVCRFWNVLSSLTPKQQSKLLRFVTGCERPPPLGFSSMNPPFTIQRVGTGGSLLRGDGSRLPTASTCFNILKLPCYGSEKVLKDRLIYAIESGAGFELT